MNNKTYSSNLLVTKNVSWNKFQSIAISIALSLFVLLNIYSLASGQQLSITEEKPSIKFHAPSVLAKTGGQHLSAYTSDENTTNSAYSPDIAGTTNHPVLNAIRVSAVPSTTAHFSVTTPITQAISGSDFDLTVTAINSSGNINTTYTLDFIHFLTFV